MESLHILRNAAAWCRAGRRAVSAELVLSHLQRPSRYKPDDALDLHGRRAGRLSLRSSQRGKRHGCSTNESRLAMERLSHRPDWTYEHSAYGCVAAVVALGHRWLWRGGGRSRGVLLAAIVALQIFAGHQQTSAYALLVAVPYALVMSRAAKESRTSYLWSLAFIAAGLALAAVQILPTFELLRNSMRADASYDFFTSFSMPPRFLLTFFAPYLMGGGDGQLFRAPYVGPTFYAEYNGYVGLVTIMLAFACLGSEARCADEVLGGRGLAGILLALGRYAPFGFYKLIYHVPVLNLFRVPARHLMEVEFALAVLAGRGLTALAAARERAKTLRWVVAVSIGVVS